MVTRLIILFLFLTSVLSAQISTDTKDNQIAKKKLQVGNTTVHLLVNAADSTIRFNLFPSTRNDSGNPVNVLSTDASGYLKSHPVSEVVTAGGGVTGNGFINRIPVWITPSYLGFMSTFRADTVNDRVMIGSQSPPSYTLDVSGTVNSTGISPGFRANAAGNAAGVGFSFVCTGIAFTANSMNTSSQAGFQLSNASAFPTFQATNTNTNSGAISVLAQYSHISGNGYGFVARTLQIPSASSNLMSLEHFASNTDSTFALPVNRRMKFDFRAGILSGVGGTTGNQVVGGIGFYLTGKYLPTAASNVYIQAMNNGSSVDIVTVKGSNKSVGFNTDNPTSSLHIDGANGYTQLRLNDSYTPTSSADANGNIGDVAWDANYFYWKTAAGWMRATGASW